MDSRGRSLGLDLGRCAVMEPITLTTAVVLFVIIVLAIAIGRRL